MNQKHLIYPFKWEERKPLIYKQILFVPNHYENHKEYNFPSFELLFGKKAPICIEYCSGNGDWIAQRAQKFPDMNWIAVEKRFDRVRKIWSKRENRGISNLFIVCGEALTFSRYYVPSNSVNEIFVNFPDPWPKGKHAKHRLVHPLFVQELFRLSVERASMTITTDDLSYRDLMIQQIHLHPGWRSSYLDPFYQTVSENYGTSWFEQLWRAKGRSIYYLNFIKQ